VRQTLAQPGPTRQFVALLDRERSKALAERRIVLRRVRTHHHLVEVPLYDVSADGQRFAVLTADRTKSSSISLLTNWPAELQT
jgi:hypothetical protein